MENEKAISQNINDTPYGILLHPITLAIFFGNSFGDLGTRLLWELTGKRAYEHPVYVSIFLFIWLIACTLYFYKVGSRLRNNYNIMITKIEENHEKN